MKISRFVIGAFASALVLSGCQLTGNGSSGGSATNIANTDFANMNCDEIKQVFDSYTEQMSNMETGGSLLSAVGVSAGTSQGLQVMRTAYSQAREIANPIIAAKQCAYQL